MNTVDHGLPKPGKKFQKDVHIPDWKGSYKPYDLVKEVTIATIVVVLLTACLAVLFSSPDDPPITLQQWSRNDPLDFVQAAITQLDGTSETADYGPPYTNVSGDSQYVGPVSLEKIVGVHIPINTSVDFVLAPLATVPNDPTLTTALATYKDATGAQQSAWTGAYEHVVQNGTVHNGIVDVASGAYGPVGTLMSNELSMAQSGALDGALITSKQFYTTDYTKVLLFLEDGTYLAHVAQGRHLLGEQWGMTNETSSWPGQAWLWLYTMLYQVPPYSGSSNADAMVLATMLVVSVLLALVPYIPGLRSIPRFAKLYRLIWKNHYRALNEKK